VIRPTASATEPTPENGESGMTLVELLIYAMLAVVVLGIVGNILIQSLTVDNSVRGRSEATKLGQLIATAVQSDVRNSTEVSWSSTPAGELLLMTTKNSAGAVSCKYQAWYYATAGDGSVRSRVSSTAIAAPTAAQLQTWTLLGSDISRDGTNHAFTRNGLAVDIRLLIETGDSDPVLIKTTVASRGTTLESTQCP
jgi:type II secretory pathway pseudopilin PulG